MKQPFSAHNSTPPFSFSTPRQWHTLAQTCCRKQPPRKELKRWKYGETSFLQSNFQRLMFSLSGGSKGHHSASQPGKEGPSITINMSSQNLSAYSCFISQAATRKNQCSLRNLNIEKSVSNFCLKCIYASLYS